MVTLAHFGIGRIFRHLRAMLGDRCVRFHVAGIMRELPWVGAAMTLLTRTRARLIGALVLYLAKPIKRYGPVTTADAGSLARVLDRGDVLLSDGDTRVAALVKRFTRSTWSHVSMYVGPLEEGPDPPCIVEADIAVSMNRRRETGMWATSLRAYQP